MERKYRQRGYSDREAQDKKRERTERPPSASRVRSGRIRYGPRTPRMVGTVTRARCSSCGAVLSPDSIANGECPRCHAALHSCKQCVHFDTGRQFECTQPIRSGIAKKDAKNECTFFEFRMTVEKDTSPVNYAAASTQSAPVSPGRPNDARKAFEDLFKK